MGDRIEEGTQRKGAEARRLAENGGRLSAEWYVRDGPKWEDKKRRALREPWVPRSRKVARDSFVARARKLRRPEVTGLGVSSR